MQNNSNDSAQRKRAFAIALSLLIAVGIWVYVDTTQDVPPSSKQINDIPIEYLSEDTTLADRGLMLLPDSDETFSLRLEGNRLILAQLDPDALRIQVDLSKITGTGVQTVNYSVVWPDLKFSRNLTVVPEKPYSVTVDIGELYSKTVELRCDIRGAVAEGYTAGEVQFQPETLTIRGQEAAVSAVSYAMAALDINNASETVTQTLEYTFCDENGQALSKAGLHASADTVQVTLPVNVVKELELKVNFIEAPGASLSNVDYTLSPAAVTVSGDAALLRDVNSIVLEDFSLAELGGAATYNYVITLPEGCTNLSGETRATMKIAFRDMTSVQLTATRFTCDHVPEGKTVTVVTGALPVHLRGTSAGVGAITAEDLTVVADLKDVGSASGSYTVPAAVLIDSDGDVGAVGTYQVTVTISDDPPQEE